VSSQSVSLSWKPPKSDGGSPITNYIVERLEFNADIQVEATWNRSAITRLTYFIDDFVTPSSKYQYRVIAQNLQGRSTPCEPTSVITTPGK
jgi:titin